MISSTSLTRSRIPALPPVRPSLPHWLLLVMALLLGALAVPRSPAPHLVGQPSGLVLSPGTEVVAWRDGHTRHYALGGGRYAALVAPTTPEANTEATMGVNRATTAGSLLKLETAPGSGDEWPGLFVSNPACTGHFTLEEGQRFYQRAYFNFPLPTLPANVGQPQIVDAQFYAAPDPDARPPDIIRDPNFTQREELFVELPVTAHPMIGSDWAGDLEDETPPPDWPAMQAPADPVITPTGSDYALLVKYNPTQYESLPIDGTGWTVTPALAQAYGAGDTHFGMGVRMATDEMESFYSYDEMIPGVGWPTFVCIPTGSPYDYDTLPDGDPINLHLPDRPGVALTIVYELPLLAPGETVGATVPSIEAEETYTNQAHQYALPQGGARWRLVAAHGNSTTGVPLPHTPLGLYRTNGGTFDELLVSDQGSGKPQYAVVSPDTPNQNELNVRILPATTPDDADHAQKAYLLQLINAQPSPPIPTPGNSTSFQLAAGGPLPRAQELNLVAGTTVEIRVALSTPDELNDARIFPPGAGVAGLSAGGAALRPGPDGVYEIEFRVADGLSGAWLLAVAPGGSTAGNPVTVTVCQNDVDVLRFPVDGECVELRRPHPATFDQDNLRTIGNVRVYSPAGFNPPGCNPQCETVAVDPDSNEPVMPLISAQGVDDHWVALKGGIATLQPGQGQLSISDGTRLVLAEFSGEQIVALPVISGAFSAATGPSPRLTPTSSPANTRLLVETPLPTEDGGEAEDGWAYAIDLQQGRLVGEGSISRVVQPTPDANPNNLFFAAASWSINAQGGSSLQSDLDLESANPNMIQLGVLQLLPPATGCDSCWQFEFNPGDADAALPAVIPRFRQMRMTQATLAQPPELGGAEVAVQAVLRNEGAAAPTEEESALHCGPNCLYVRGDGDTLQNPSLQYAMPDIIVQDDLGAMAFMGDNGDLHLLGPEATDDVNIGFNFEAFGGSIRTSDGLCPGLRDPLDPLTEPEPSGGKTTLIQGEANITLPGIGQNQDLAQAPELHVSFTLCQSSLREARIYFDTGPNFALPLGDSKLFVNLIGGTVAITPDAAQIALEVGARSPTPAAATSFVFIRGYLILDSRGLLDIHANLGVQVLGPIGYAGTGHLWVGWSPLDLGFEFRGCLPQESGSLLEPPNFQKPGDPVDESSLCQDDPILYGMIRAHMWQGCGWQCRYAHLPDNEDIHFAGRFESDVNLPKGLVVDWKLLKIPWKTVTVREADLAIGEFCTSGPCTEYEWGVMGAMGLLGYKVGLYYDFGTDLHFILGNANFCLIDEIGAGDTCPQPVNAAPLPGLTETPDNSAVFPVPESADSVLFAMAWNGPAPTVHVYSPGGAEVDLTDPAVTVTIEETDEGHVYLLAVEEPDAGNWLFELQSLAPQTEYDLLFAANGAPQLTYSLQVPSPADEDDTATIQWNATDFEFYSDLKVSFYWEQRAPGNQTLGGPIAERVPLEQGSVHWDLAGLGDSSGGSPINVYARLENASAAVISGCGDVPYNPDPQAACSTMTNPDLALAGEAVPVDSFLYVDTQPPAAPVLLNVRAESETAVFLRWQANDEADLAGYALTCNQPGLSRRARVVPAYPAAAGLPEGAAVHGLDAGVSASCFVQAYDASGNLSQPSGTDSATPTGNPPAPPVQPEVAGWSGGFGSLLFEWQPVPGASGYYLYVNAFAGPATNSPHLNSVSSGAPQMAAPHRWPIDTGKATHHRLHGLEPGSYELWVRAYDAEGRTGPDSKHITVIVQDGGITYLPLIHLP